MQGQGGNMDYAVAIDRRGEANKGRQGDGGQKKAKGKRGLMGKPIAITRYF